MWGVRDVRHHPDIETCLRSHGNRLCDDVSCFVILTPTTRRVPSPSDFQADPGNTRRTPFICPYTQGPWSNLIQSYTNQDWNVRPIPTIEETVSDELSRIVHKVFRHGDTSQRHGLFSGQHHSAVMVHSSKQMIWR